MFLASHWRALRLASESRGTPSAAQSPGGDVGRARHLFQHKIASPVLQCTVVPAHIYTATATATAIVAAVALPPHRKMSLPIKRMAWPKFSHTSRKRVRNAAPAMNRARLNAGHEPATERGITDPGYMSRQIRKFRTDKFDTWNKRKF